MHALERANSIGLYFDGDGDCSCCGDRWSDYENVTDLDKIPSPDAPLIKDESAEYGSLGMKWMDEGEYETFVDPLDESFYGAHSTTQVINPHVYGKENGYGVSGSSEFVNKPFAVNAKGWAEDGNQYAPGPESSRYCEEVEEINGVRISMGQGIISSQFSAWFPTKTEATKFYNKVKKWQSEHKFDVTEFLA